MILPERAKGWKRRALASLYLVIALAVGAYGWHVLCLWRLPDSPDPFDLAKYGRVAVPDPDNAKVAYRDVFSKFGDLHAGSDEVSDRAAAGPAVRRWAEAHRGALEA